MNITDGESHVIALYRDDRYDCVVRDDCVVNVEVSEYGDCKLFKKNPICYREGSSGQVIVVTNNGLF